MTLKDLLNERGFSYESEFTNRAKDINFNDVEDLCLSLGYILEHVKKN